MIRKDISHILAKLEISEGFVYPNRYMLEDELYIRAVRLFCLLIEGHPLAERISFTEYPYILTNLVSFSITGKAENTLHPEKKFNETGKCVALEILKRHLPNEWDARSLMLCAIQSGMIGLDQKESQAYANDIGIEAGSILRAEEAFHSLQNEIKNIGVFEYDYFEAMFLIPEESRHLAFFTDDMIETVFDLKLIEAMLKRNPLLTVTIIPKDGQYGNDASYIDVISLLTYQDVWKELPVFAAQGRFHVCQGGNQSGISDVRKLPEATLEVLRIVDGVLFKGCRGMEISQGRLDIPCFYAFTVIRDFNQSQTGLHGDRHPAVLCFCPPRRKLYWGFQARTVNRDNALFTLQDTVCLNKKDVGAVRRLREKLLLIKKDYPIYQQDCCVSLLDCDRILENIVL